jgi:large subunit ribosomal protein L9
MKVILKEAVENLGDLGEVVNVKPGFARNYLLPKGLAYTASEANLQLVEEEHALAQERAKRDYLEAKRRASQLEGVSLTFTAKAGEEGRLFGSITNIDIADRLAEQGLDFEIDRRRVVVAEPIKDLGVHTATVRLFSEVEVEIEVNVEREAE